MLLLAGVSVMRLSFNPHAHFIPESDLLTRYKHPRRRSFVPLWAIICLVVCMPLLFFSVPFLKSKNYMETTQTFLAWTLAVAMNAVLTELFKVLSSRPRPDFFYRCFPNGVMTKGLHCTGSLKEIIEGRKSFPSGHSSFSFCSMGFLSFWLCGRLGVMSRKRGEGLRVVICLIPLLVAAAVAISRCCDNHHHWEDVLVGAVIGLLTSYMCYTQYFNPLDSDLSGYSYTMTENQLWNPTSRTECCTRYLNSIVNYLH